MMNFNILHEIGELFGRSIRTDGAGNRIGVEDFSVAISNTLPAGNDFNSLQDGTPPQKTNQNPFFSGVLATKYRGSRYYGWQKRIISHLEGGSSNDVYVVAPPGGGKTTPLMAHYVINMLLRGHDGDFASLNAENVFDRTRNNQVIDFWTNIFLALLTGKYSDGKRIPRVLFITPIRVLALEQGEGFQDIFIDLLVFLKTIILTYPGLGTTYENVELREFLRYCRNSPITAHHIIANIVERVNNFRIPNSERTLAQLLMDNNEQNIDQFDSYVRQKSLSMVSVNTGGGSGGFTGNINSAPAIIATAGSAKNQIDKIADSVDFIVYDEAHLYQPFGVDSGRSQSGEIQNASDCYKIINAVCKSNTQIAFLSGTIHPASAQNLADFLRIRYKRNITVIATEKGDTESKNKTALKVIPDDSLRDENKVVQYIINWINRGETGNAVLLFSKAKIKRILDKVLSKLSPKSSTSREQPKAASERIKRYERELKYSGLSRQEIEQRIRDFTRENYPTSQGEMISRIKNKPGASSIENNELKNAVSFGIGYIFTQDDKDLSAEDRAAGKEKISERDKLIVADLFSKQKINVLLATPSIGVGVNVSIVNMYLPTLLKFEGKPGSFGGNMELINKRELSQLINRAGRGVTDISGIYTPTEFVSYVRDIINMGNDNYDVVPAITISAKDDLTLAITRLQEAGSNRAKAIYGTITGVHGKSVAAKNWVKNVLKKAYIKIVPSRLDPLHMQEIIDRETREFNDMLQTAQLIQDNMNDVNRFVDQLTNQQAANGLFSLLNNANNIIARLRTRWNDIEGRITQNPTQYTPEQLSHQRLLQFRCISNIIRQQTRIITFITGVENRVTEKIADMRNEIQNDTSGTKRRQYEPRIRELENILRDLRNNRVVPLQSRSEQITQLRNSLRNVNSNLDAMRFELRRLGQQGNNVNLETLRIIQQSVQDLEVSKDDLEKRLRQLI